MRPLPAALLLALALPAAAGRHAPSAPDSMHETAAVVAGRALAARETTWARMQELCDDIGHRLTGSPGLERAIDWAAEHMARDGLAVRKEPVQVQKWVRGEERLTLLGDPPRRLPMLGLGNSVGTPSGGLEAEVVVADDFDQLDALDVSGKVVLFDVPFTTYGETVPYRIRGPSEAARRGAAAVLVRSVAPTGLSTPHTGMLRYAEDAPQVPAAAVDHESASQLRRLVERGRAPRIRLEMGARFEGEVTSHNVIGELRGRARPDEVVVVGCHIDAWDVGTGAQDDAAGCVAAMETGRILAGLDRRPARTVRVVLYTNEENGLAGGRTYARVHADETHVAAIEMDTGAGPFLGYRVDGRTGGPPEADTAERERLVAELAAVAPLFAALGPAWVPGYAGADVGPLVRQGVLGFGIHMDTTDYWPIHHTEADTLDKIDRGHLQRNVAGMALLTWVLAEWEAVPTVRTSPGGAP